MATDNPNLTCIEVDDTIWSETNWMMTNDPLVSLGLSPNIDSTSSFSTNCNNPCTITDINEHTFMTINAYPNPFSSSTTLEFPNYSQEPHTLSVYDITGNRIRMVENITSNKMVVERDDLSDGIYLFELRSATQTLNGKLVVK